MRHTAFRFLALISLACVAAAATRPHYGGTLRVEMQSAPANLELPSLSSPADYWNTSRILSLIGDNLVTIDAEGRLQPALALKWDRDSAARHWQFTLRGGVKFHDSTLASPAIIAKILGALHPDWTIQASADSLTIDTESPNPTLLAELALPRNLILSRTASGIPIGTGPFRIVDYQPGKLLKLAANEEGWSGRPYLDAIEIELGKSPRDQTVALELGRVDLIEAAPQAANSSPFLRNSLPVELLALVFPPNSKAQDPRLREALALSIDRNPIRSVLLKGAGEPTAALLPNWMTGYSAAFSTQPDIRRAKALLAESQQSLTITQPKVNPLMPSPLLLSYDPRDPQSQLIAERIALNAREAGITVQVSLSGAADMQLVRIALPTPDPALALREVAHHFELFQPVIHGDGGPGSRRRLSDANLGEPAASGSSIEDLYQAERALLDSTRIIPLFHLPVASAVAPRIHSWNPDLLGSWNLANVWLEPARSDNSRPESPR
jgi:peptide/nickel transport system substrate-binding protein